MWLQTLSITLFEATATSTANVHLRFLWKTLSLDALFNQPMFAVKWNSCKLVATSFINVSQSAQPDYKYTYIIYIYYTAVFSSFWSLLGFVPSRCQTVLLFKFYSRSLYSFWTCFIHLNFQGAVLVVVIHGVTTVKATLLVTVWSRDNCHVICCGKIQNMLLDNLDNSDTLSEAYEAIRLQTSCSDVLCLQK